VIAWNWANLRSASWGTNLGEKVNVRLVVLAPLTWQVVFVVNGLDRANWLTSSTVHALIRVDVKHAVALIDTVHRAFVDASFVFDINTRKGDYVSHK
jgi:hypothetical protein